MRTGEALRKDKKKKREARTRDQIRELVNLGESKSIAFVLSQAIARCQAAGFDPYYGSVLYRLIEAESALDAVRESLGESEAIDTDPAAEERVGLSPLASDPVEPLTVPDLLS